MTLPDHMGSPIPGHPKDRRATPAEVEQILFAHQPGGTKRRYLTGRYGTAGETVATVLAAALGDVGYTPAGDNQHTKYNVWFAALYGQVYWSCAWCAISQCYWHRGGSIPDGRRSAGAWALVDNFPRLPRPQPGALIGYQGQWYPEGHVEMVVRTDPNPNYVWAVGGNTSGGGQGRIGVWLTRRYLPGSLYGYSWPQYAAAPPPVPHPVIYQEDDVVIVFHNPDGSSAVAAVPGCGLVGVSSTAQAQAMYPGYHDAKPTQAEWADIMANYKGQKVTK